MADVNIQGGGGGGSGTNTVLAIVIIALLALLAWFFFARGGDTDGADIKVDVNTPPAATSGGTGGSGSF